MVQKVNGSAFPWKVQVRDHSGKVKSRSFAKKEDAEAFEAKIRRDRQLVRSGLERPKDDILLIDYFASWMRRRVKEVPRSTWEMDDSRFRNHIATTFGALPMQMISSAQWKEHFESLIHEKGLSKASRNRVRALMHKLYQDAFMEDRVVFNPISKIPLLEEAIKRRRTIWTEGQYEAYIAAAYDVSPYCGLFAVISIFEGTRISETLALRFSDIDPNKGLLWISRIYEQESHQIVDRTKGDESGRGIPLFPRVKEAIDRHFAIHPYRKPSSYLFARETQHPIDPYTMRRLHAEATARAKLNPITPHGLRHLFASIAEFAGFSTFERKEMLGHSTIAMTERYTHLSMNPLLEKARSIGFGSITGGNVSPIRHLERRAAKGLKK